MSSNSTCFGLIWAHHQEVQQYVYSSWYLEFFLDDCLLSLICCLSSVVCCLSSFVLVVPNQPAQKTTDSHLKRIVSTYCSTHTDVPPDDGPRYARNMQRLTKYTKNKLCIKLVFLYTIISRCTVNNT